MSTMKRKRSSAISKQAPNAGQGKASERYATRSIRKVPAILPMEHTETERKSTESLKRVQSMSPTLNPKINNVLHNSGVALEKPAQAIHLLKNFKIMVKRMCLTATKAKQVEQAAEMAEHTAATVDTSIQKMDADVVLAEVNNSQHKLNDAANMQEAKENVLLDDAMNIGNIKVEKAQVNASLPTTNQPSQDSNEGDAALKKTDNDAEMKPFALPYQSKKANKGKEPKTSIGSVKKDNNIDSLKNKYRKLSTFKETITSTPIVKLDEGDACIEAENMIKTN